MSATKQILYAAVGVGELAVEKARKARNSIDPAEVGKQIVELPSRLPKRVADARGRFEKAGTKAYSRGIQTYRGLVKRGQKRVLGLRNSGPAKRAVAQTKTAGRQTKAAVASVRKAATGTAEAAKEAASNL